MENRIKHLREQNHLTQTDLARRLHITRSSVNAWEQGISVPSTSILIELASMFHVSTDYLLGIRRSATLDISQLNEEEILILQNLIQHFLKSKSV